MRKLLKRLQRNPRVPIMTPDDPFLEWLQEQDYWLNNDRVREEWPNAQFRSMAGVTCKMDEETGELVTPRRDFRNTYVIGSADPPEDTEEES